MTSRERLVAALRHREPDRVPLDLGATQVTTIHAAAYRRLRSALGLPEREPVMMDLMQQAVIPDEDVLERLEVDTRGLYPRVNTNWNMERSETGEGTQVRDEWQTTHRLPRGAEYYSLAESPLSETMLTTDAIDGLSWPVADDPRRWKGLRKQAESLHAAGFPVVMRGLCAGILEMACRLRPMDKFMMELALDEKTASHLLGCIADRKAAFWEAALEELGDVVDVVAEADDYGTQESMLISPDMYRRLLKPLQKRLFDVIRSKLKDGFIFFHSCGNVRELIPYFIEIGVDILNPVHVRAAGMEPVALKKDFGRDISFWGGGVDTQGVLPGGTPEDVRADVTRNVEALMGGGGYVFNTVHNIQSDVPPENVIAMWEAFRKAGRY